MVWLAITPRSVIFLPFYPLPIHQDPSNVTSYYLRNPDSSGNGDWCGASHIRKAKVHISDVGIITPGSANLCDLISPPMT